MKANVSALVAAYNEHERRREAYAGRALSHEERLDLALAGLAQAARSGRATVADFLAASEVCDARLRRGQKVGTAIRAAIDSMPAAQPAVAGEA